MKRSATLAVLAMLAFCAAANGAQSGATLEMNNRALFIRAEETIIKEIKAWAEYERARRPLHFEKVKQTISERYGQTVEMEGFSAEEPASVSGVQMVRIGVREAVLTGRIPPVEGLSTEEAMIVLKAFGFIAYDPRVFYSLSEQEKIRLLIESDRPLLVLESTGAFDKIRIYFKQEMGRNN